MAASHPLEELSLHLQELEEAPATPLDTRLLEHCELVTTTPEYRTSQWKETGPLFMHIASLLPKLQTRPTPLVNLAIKLADPYPFEHIKHINLEPGLALEATDYHQLTLFLLNKATASKADADALAVSPSVMHAVVRLWLCTPDAGTAFQAANLILSLLRVSKDAPEVSASHSAHQTQYGTASMWKRLFRDRDIYFLYYKYTTTSKLAAPAEPILNKRDRTLAQARLLEWLPQVAKMDWTTVTTSHYHEIEKECGLPEGQGLLHYVVLKMVDIEDDMLMHMSWINFCSELITTVKTPHITQRNTSASLAFLQEYGVHQKIIDYHINGNADMEHSFISPRSAHYIAEYTSHYPVHFEKSAEMGQIRQYVREAMHDASNLSIIAAMPRSTLIPRNGNQLLWDQSVVLDIPLKGPNGLKTLATVFHGPLKEEITFPAPDPSTTPSPHTEREQFYARLLTATYYNKNPSMFGDLVALAETITLADTAIAALTLLRAIITSNWPPSSLLPSEINSEDPTYTRITTYFPASSLAAVLDPTISGPVLPYLLKPATKYSNLVGGAGGAENAAYQVAMAKFDVLKALESRLGGVGGGEADARVREIASMVRRRVSQGPWGVGGEAGSRIGTLEL